MGADDTEQVSVIEGLDGDRGQDISGQRQITAWTKFIFPGRAGTYSDFQYISYIS